MISPNTTLDQKSVPVITATPVRIEQLTVERKAEWNAFVSREPSFALMQSWEWGEFKEQFGWKVYRIAAEQQGQIIAGAQMLIKPLPLAFASIAYVPRGPLGSWLDEQIAPALFQKLHEIARSHGAIFLKIEPPLMNNPVIDQAIRAYNFHPSHYSNQPRASIVIDLSPDLDEIFHQMRKRTQEYIKHSIKQGVTVCRGSCDDLEGFCDLMRITGHRGHFPTRTKDYYKQEWQMFADRDQALMLVAYDHEQALAMHMAYRFGDYAAYFHGASSGVGSDLRPNYLLVWEAIKWAKEQGYRTYDLWGIPDEVGRAVYEGQPQPKTERTDGLWGVYRFKSGFSKNIVYYVGAYDYVYAPLPYALINNRWVDLDTLDQVSALMDHLKHS